MKYSDEHKEDVAKRITDAQIGLYTARQGRETGALIVGFGLFLYAVFGSIPFLMLALTGLGIWILFLIRQIIFKRRIRNEKVRYDFLND